jgi:hypothetical protein
MANRPAASYGKEQGVKIMVGQKGKPTKENENSENKKKEEGEEQVPDDFKPFF